MLGGAWRVIAPSHELCGCSPSPLRSWRRSHRSLPAGHGGVGSHAGDVLDHGGGFKDGSSAVAVYDGARLANTGVVVISVNYRVGPLGSLAHPELSAESGDHTSDPPELQFFARRLNK